MVAMSMADGYARLTGQPQAVIVHVDVGTQALGQAFHNACSGHAPVFVFAGMTPFTQDGELRGSRNEFINWYQDVPDQKAICAQYCRYSAEVHTGRNIKQMVARAIQFATSKPQGPVYLCAPREVLEEELTPYSIDQEHWAPVDLGALPTAGVKEIATALVKADNPLIITGHTGRDHATPALLADLADAVPGLRIFDAGMTDMSFPQSHPACLTPLAGARPAIATADTILILDSDVPWVPAATKPRSDARIFHIDADPLKRDMLLFYIPANRRYRASAQEAILQLTEYISASSELKGHISTAAIQSKFEARSQAHKKHLEAVALRGQPPKAEGLPSSVAYLCAQLKEICPPHTIWVSEAVTNHVSMQDQIRASLPGTFITKGGAGLGWNGGASLAIKMAAEDVWSSLQKHKDAATNGVTNGSNATLTPAYAQQKPFVVNITGDGSYLFSNPSSTYWLAQNLRLPVLTVVLNNGGWQAPKNSAKSVNPDSVIQSVNDLNELKIGFGTRESQPRYAGIAHEASAGWIGARRVRRWEDVKGALEVGKRWVDGSAEEVKGEPRGYVIDVWVS